MKSTLFYKVTLGFLFLLLTYTPYLSAQNLPVMIYGGSNDERCFAIVEAANNDGYLLAGWTKSYGPGTPAFSNVLAVKVDSFGVPQGGYISQGIFDDEGHSLTQTLDGGYAMTGWTKSYGFFPSDSSDIFVVKTDSIGTLQWGYVYGSPWC
ncbi:hypothetical protein AMJ52_09575, partial [candidate division TA06 bacterium DG_78]